MASISQTEENYLKVIFKLCEQEGTANTTAISQLIHTSAASVSDMLKRLARKQVIYYEKWRGVTLTETGNRIATRLIRQHRLWEVFLVEKLKFSWDEVHDIAEQLEHIHSKELMRRLDDYLGNPEFDPHGDPIPDEDGNFAFRKRLLLSELQEGQEGIVVGVNEHSATFLQYLERINLVLRTKVKMLEKFEYDESVHVLLNDEKEQVLSSKVSQNIFLKLP